MSSRPSSRSAERHWVYDGDPAIRVAALAEGETVSLTARDSDGATTTYTVRFVGCGVVQVGGVDERVNHYEVREGAESTGTGKIVSLSMASRGQSPDRVDYDSHVNSHALRQN